MTTDVFSSEVSPSVRLKNRKLHHLPNAALLSLVQAGDQQAAHGLMNRFLPLIQRTAYRLTSDPSDAADLASEIYLRVFEVLPSCRTISTFPGWIRKIAVNLYFVQCRKKRYGQLVSLEHLMEVAGDHFAPTTGFDPAQEVLGEFVHKERIQRVQMAIKTLPPLHRELVEMFYGDNQSYEQIAGRTGLSLGTIKSRLFRARGSLQRKLSDLIA